MWERNSKKRGHLLFVDNWAVNDCVTSICVKTRLFYQQTSKQFLHLWSRAFTYSVDSLSERYDDWKTAFTFIQCSTKKSSGISLANLLQWKKVSQFTKFPFPPHSRDPSGKNGNEDHQCSRWFIVQTRTRKWKERKTCYILQQFSLHGVHEISITRMYC